MTLIQDRLTGEKVLRIEENEDLDCYIEDIDSPLDYYN